MIVKLKKYSNLKSLLTQFVFNKTTQESRDLAAEDSICSDTMHLCSASDGTSVAYCGCVMHGSTSYSSKCEIQVSSKRS